ncbi:thiamine phosphate synthase [Robertmurraya sp. DFI.2.37]|jgi:thiamine-phosphate pyrophosphorylase|uniref:thiamine phosphate synthase n=1 Tax=Robertmurraya sp. DFI.2.37 TaxID=3031819 RepID=UPI001243ABAF|nr:thiamine phosphate synthase [Robertmurraya sp. DFI.2.37]MDF1508505.1 thiamine phosphate synthase [Robertmurraya sp. DFI.2.37]
MKEQLKLYLVTEESIPLPELLAIVEEAIKGGVTAVQLREKTNSGKLFFEKALKLKELTSRYEVPLYINDRVDIALAVEADGIHVGQEDLPLTSIKQIIPPTVNVGVSAGSVEEAIAAEKDGADYIGVGAVFPTASKDDAKVLAEGELEKIIEAVSIPVVAIGGIKLNNIERLKDLPIAGIAIVSEIMKADSPRKAASLLRGKLN